MTLSHVGTTLIITGGLFAAIAATVNTSTPPACSLRVEVGEWHDADTPKRCRVHLPLGVLLDERDGLRASNYDAWEVGHRPGQTITEAEKSKGRTALAALRDTFDESDLRLVPHKDGRDKYGRILGELWLRRTADGRWLELGSWARSEGHTR